MEYDTLSKQNEMRCECLEGSDMITLAILKRYKNNNFDQEIIKQHQERDLNFVAILEEKKVLF
jgi:hypothetical protein